MMLALTTQALVAFAWGPIIILIGLVGLVLYLRRRHPADRTFVRQTKPRHIATRIVCGSLAAGILIAVAVSTWLDLGRVYDVADPAATTLRVPTLPLPELKKSGDEEVTLPPEGLRLCCYFIVAEEVGDSLVPLDVRQTDLAWPPPDSQIAQMQASIDVGDMAFGFTGDIERFAPGWAGSGQELPFVIRLGTHFGRKGLIPDGIGRGSISGGFRPGQLANLARQTVGTPTLPLSLLPRGSFRGVRVLWLFLAARPDDPLKAVSLADFAATHLATADQPDDVYTANGGKAGLAPAIRLAGHFGSASIFLCAAALLAMQLFRWRAMAFAGTTLAVVLFVVAGDRAMLHVHLDRAADASAPLAERVRACQLAERTLFYRQTAQKGMNQIANEVGAPQALRTEAHRLESQLNHPPILSRVN